MTRDWIADEYGDLQPEVAQAIGRAPGGEPARGAPRRAERQRRISWAGWFVALGLFLSMVAFWKLQDPPRPTDRSTHRSAIPAPPKAPAVTVFGANVNLRAAPNVKAIVVSRLHDGQQLTISAYQNGWYEVSASRGDKGWVFGAFVRGHKGPVVGQGVVIHPLRLQDDRKLFAGDKVLVERRLPDGRMILLFPDGVHGHVSGTSIRLDK